MTSAPNVGKDLHEELQSLANQLLHAKKTLESGRSVDLAHLEPRVELLCSNLKKLPPAEAGELKSKLTGIIEELSHLESLLRAGLGCVKERLGEVSERQRALHAYSQGKP